MAKQDGRVIAHENETKVLRALHRFGWLRAKDLAGLVWQAWADNPKAEPSMLPVQATQSGLRSAQVTLRRMVEAKLVLPATVRSGSKIYTLSYSGAQRLRLSGVPADSGKDLVRDFSDAHFTHRATANEIAIAGIKEGFRVSTEREVARDRWFGGSKGIGGKKPDVILRAGNRIWWVEVERSRKNQKDYARLIHWLGAVARDARREDDSAMLPLGMRWAQILFVCQPSFESRLCAELKAAGWSAGAMATLLGFHPINLYLGRSTL